MSDKIVPFPAKHIRDWNMVSNTMREILVDAGLNEEMAIKFITDFKPIFESFQFEYPLSFSVSDKEMATTFEKELSKYQLALQQHISKLIFDRFTRELGIYCKNL